MEPVEIRLSGPSEELVASVNNTESATLPIETANTDHSQSFRVSKVVSTIGIEIENFEKIQRCDPTVFEKEISYEESEYSDDESHGSLQLQLQNAVLRAECDKTALDRDDFKVKYNALLAERSNLRRKKLWASTAKIQRAFLELRSRVAAWCDEASNIGANQEHSTTLEPRAADIPFLKFRRPTTPKLPPPSSKKIGYMTRLVWQELVGQAFPSETTLFDKTTDLWMDAKDGELVAEIVKRMEPKVSADDLRLWICMTAVALQPDPENYNRRLIKVMERICSKVDTYLGLNQVHDSSLALIQDDVISRSESTARASPNGTLKTDLHPALLSLKAKLMFEVLPKVAELSCMLRRCPLRTHVRWPPEFNNERLHRFRTCPVVITPELTIFEHVEGIEQTRVLVEGETLNSEADVMSTKSRKRDNVRKSIKSVFSR